MPKGESRFQRWKQFFVLDTLGRCPRLGYQSRLWRSLIIPSHPGALAQAELTPRLWRSATNLSMSAPTAHFHQSLGQRPRETFPKKTSAESANQSRPPYKFFATQLSTRSRAFSMFSIEFATLKRK